MAGVLVCIVSYGWFRNIPDLNINLRNYFRVLEYRCSLNTCFHETDDYHEVFHIQLKPYILFTDVGLGLPMTLLRTRVTSSLVVKDIFIAVCTYQMRKSEKC